MNLEEVTDIGTRVGSEMTVSGLLSVDLDTAAAAMAKAGIHEPDLARYALSVAYGYVI